MGGLGLTFDMMFWHLDKFSIGIGKVVPYVFLPHTHVGALC